MSWAGFEEELWARFGPTEGEDFDEALSHIRQVGTLRDYQQEFERLGNCVRGWTQKALVGTFMGGLRPEIADGIRIFKPRTLKDAISLTRMREEQLSRHRRFIRPPPLVRALPAPPQPARGAPQLPAAPVKRLTWEEMQRKQAQGLCFHFNERFTAGHRCQRPQLLLLEGHTGTRDVICEEVADQQAEEAGPDEVHETEPEPEINLHALTGWTAPKTIRVMATIESLEMVVLIDSGSTHNFIGTRVARLLRLPVVPTEEFTVRVANGERLKCHGRFERVPVLLQGIPFLLTLYELPITGLDLVLGVQWLETLGSVVCNWRHLTMEFKWEHQVRKLQGTHHQHIQTASLKELTKELRQGQSLFAVYMHNATSIVHEGMPPDMQGLLEEYTDIFKEPTKLPPAREVEHRIPLKEGVEPVNVRPYMYAYFQKAEIEKQVQDMLQQGII